MAIEPVDEHDLPCGRFPLDDELVLKDGREERLQRRLDAVRALEGSQRTIHVLEFFRDQRKCGPKSIAAMAALNGRTASPGTVVYYFPTKDCLVVSVVRALGAERERLLDVAFGTEPLSPPELVQRAWPVMATADAAPVLAVYFEMVGLAAGGRGPFASLARASLEWWATWLTPKILPAATATRRSGALAAIAALDGLLLVRHVLGAEAAEQAAQGAGTVVDR